MNREILVKAQADHIESLFRSAPLGAIEELVWNALDADAHEVRVDLVTNALGAVDAVRVTDDGTGIDALEADATFGALGGSWKRNATETSLAHRRLHGRHGRGRFKAFALGCRVAWRTTCRRDGELRSYEITGDADRPGVFELAAVETGPAAGTEVCVSNVRAASDVLLDAGETVSALAARFALYLKSYPDVRIYFNGLPVTPVVVQKSSCDYRVTLENGAEAKLEVIEWKRRFTGSGRLVLAGPDGFALHELPAGVRSGVGASFTAYLVSPRFPALHAENALALDELHPEVRANLDAAKKILKAHFVAEEGAPDAKAAFEQAWSERIEALSHAERKMLLALLKRSLKAAEKTEP